MVWALGEGLAAAIGRARAGVLHEVVAVVQRLENPVKPCPVVFFFLSLRPLLRCPLSTAEGRFPSVAVVGGRAA